MILDRYIFRQLLMSMVGSMSGLLLILFPPLILSALSRLGGVGLPVLLGYLPYLGLELLPYLLPLSFLLAITATYSRMAGNGEWTATMMAGIHPVRAGLPGVLLALLCAAGSFYLLHDEMPAKRFEQRNYERSAAVDILRRLLPGKTTIQAGGFSVVSKRRRGNVLEDVAVRLPPEGGGFAPLILGKSLRFASDENGLLLTMEDPRVFRKGLSAAVGQTHLYVRFDDFIPLSKPNPDVPKYQRSAQLRERSRELEPGHPHLRGLSFEVEKRNALAASYLVFLLLGIPAGLRLKTTAMLAPLTVAALSSCVYYVVSLRLGKEIAITGDLPPWLGAWSANLLALATSLVLIWRSSRR